LLFLQVPFVQLLDALLCATMADNRTSTVDPLMTAVRSHPQQALKFVKAVTLMGSVAAVVVSIPSGIFLWMHWTPCGFCNRPLKYWLLVQSFLQMLQVPVRLRFFLRIRHAQQHNQDLQQMFLQMTSSAAWRSSKTVSLATYAWFVLGVVWLLNSSYCKECPGMYRLCLAVVFSCMARLLMTLVYFHSLFKQDDEDTDENKPKGASQSLIDSIPQEQFSPKCSGATSELSCAVCLNEFEGNDMLRRLPCNHCFHCACVDEWLKHNKTCPLCVQDVEVLSRRQAEKRRSTEKEGASVSCLRRFRDLW